MKKNLILTLTIIALFQMGCAENSNSKSFENDLNSSSQIVGGVAAAKNEFGFIASLQDDSEGHFCGGSLIAPKWVLTAAHCVTKGVDSVILGLYSQKNKSGSKKVSVKNIVVHPQNTKENYGYDFALLELAEDQTSQIALLPPNEKFTDNLILKKQVTTVAGWGSNGKGGFFGGGLTDILQKVNVPLVDSIECSKDSQYQGKISESMMCAGFKQGGRDSCQGDSGGPLIVRAPGGTPYLLGVVSWGVGCAKPNKYGVYGKVNHVTTWIKEIIK